LKFEIPEIDIFQVPVSLLAYIGDAVMSLYFKTKYLKLMKPSEVERKVKEIVSRKGQAEILDAIWDKLNEEEKAVIKRAMNSKGAKRYGNDPLYRKSTGLEALIGYLYVSRSEDRLKEILELKILQR
jgi:ribonuclease-3 family protein